MKILYDHDIEPLLSYRTCIQILEKTLLSKASQQLISPPRDYFLTEKGALVFTKGELIQEKAAGFRLYAIPKKEQITVVVNTHTGGFKGIIIGKSIGVYRTACLNALAIKYLALKNATVLGVIGSGLQARHHALAALEVRAIDKLIVYSRNSEKRENFIQFIQAKSNNKDLMVIAAASPEEVAENSDILICATNSTTPILKTSAIKKGLHINNIGPKYQNRHELPLTTYQKANKIITDSIPQLYDAVFLGDICFKEIIPQKEILSLERCMTNFDRKPNDITLFCSMGLSGTEVAIANWVFEVGTG